MHRLDWEKLRYFIVVARSGTLVEAAKRLGVNHATVFRQINQFEQDINARLFVRSRDGYRLTDLGDELMKHATDVEEKVLSLEREVLGRDSELSGHIRVTTTDTLGVNYLAKHIASFKSQYPQVSVELLIGHANFDLGRREADVAIRASRQPKGDIIGKRIAAISFAVYGEKNLIGRKKPSLANDFEDLPFLELSSEFNELTSYQWLARAKSLKRAGVQCNSMVALLSLAEEGAGLALIPCFHADRSAKLKRLTDPDPSLGADLWVLTNKEFQKNSRIRAFIDHMYVSLSLDKSSFEGKA